MNDRSRQLCLDLIQGMRNRATQLHYDDDGDGRNGNWYARQMYEERYVEIRKAFQKQVIGDSDYEK